jgi:hypothetical protein
MTKSSFPSNFVLIDDDEETIFDDEDTDGHSDT